jgi:hypothetical protein
MCAERTKRSTTYLNCIASPAQPEFLPCPLQFCPFSILVHHITPSHPEIPGYTNSVFSPDNTAAGCETAAGWIYSDVVDRGVMMTSSAMQLSDVDCDI